MALDPTLQAGLAVQSPQIFHAVDLTLPDGTTHIRLLDCSIADITVDGHVFTSEDPTYGTMAITGAFTDGVSDDVPHLTVTYYPPTNTAAAAIAGANMQGCSIKAYMGAINTATGQPIGTSDGFFVGEVDVPTLQVGLNSRAVEIDSACVWERLFENDEGLGLTNASHQSIWPGEAGFDMVTDVERQLPWGPDAPRPGVITSASASGSTAGYAAAAAAAQSQMGYL